MTAIISRALSTPSGDQIFTTRLCANPLMHACRQHTSKPPAGMQGFMLAYLSCFGEGNDISNRRCPSQQHDEPIQTQGNSPVGGRPHIKGI